MTDRELCTWRIRSTVPLPDLRPWRGDDRPPDIEIRLMPEGNFETEGDIPFDADGVGRFHVVSGSMVTIDTRLDPATPELRGFVYGSALSVLCHQRGVLPLHAGCVAIDGRAIVVAGPSGAGKSSITALLVGQGRLMLAEDLCPISWPESRVLPSVPRLKLHREVLGDLALSSLDLRKIDGTEKFAVPVGPEDLGNPTRPAAIYIIDPDTDVRHPQVERLKGIDALKALRDLVLAWDLAHAHGLSAAAFRAVAGLAASVPVYRLTRPTGIGALASVATMILERETAP